VPPMHLYWPLKIEAFSLTKQTIILPDKRPG